MPRLAIDFTRTIIYKLVCKDLTIKEIYVGATTNWSNRQGEHKKCCINPIYKKKYNYKVYKFIREHGGFENWTMIMVEEYSCENKLQSDAREHFWTENLGAKLNSYVVGRTKNEYYEDNKEEIAEKKKIHYEANKEDILEKTKVYRDNHKEEIAEKRKIHYEANKEEISEKKKEWYEANKAEINKKAKIHREANKEEISEKKKEKYTCDCGSIICKDVKARHNKTNKHINYLSTL